MKSINQYILEKLKITKNYKWKWDPEYELKIPESQLAYIDSLILVANNKKIDKSSVKIIYDAFINEDTVKKYKYMENFRDNLIKYLNNHPDLPEMLGDTFDDIYGALQSLPENELIQYRGKLKNSK